MIPSSNADLLIAVGASTIAAWMLWLACSSPLRTTSPIVVRLVEIGGPPLARTVLVLVALTLAFISMRLVQGVIARQLRDSDKPQLSWSGTQWSRGL